MNLVELNGIKKTFLLGQTKVPALSGVDLSIRKGEFTVVTGPSGSGKTVMLSSFYGAAQEPKFLKESVFRLIADDIGQGHRLHQNFLGMKDEARAPITVGNFLRYVDEGYYDGTIIQRVLVGKDARINIFQGGGYTATGRAYAAEDKPKPGQHGPIKLESQGGLKNERGTIAMARDSDPDTATSEFFVNVEDNPKLAVLESA